MPCGTVPYPTQNRAKRQGNKFCVYGLRRFVLCWERKEAGEMTFSEKLITLRGGRGWSQEKLAQELGVTRQAVGRWERGSGLPDANSLMAIARACSTWTRSGCSTRLRRSRSRVVSAA